MKIRIVLLSLICFSTLGFSSKLPDDVSKTFESLEKNSKAVSAEQVIKKHLTALESNKVLKISGEKVFANDAIMNLYKEVNYAPLWDNKQNKSDLLEILQDSYFEGLNPKDYHIDFIQNFTSPVVKESDKEPELLAVADILMTDAILTYAYHLIYGKVDPNKLDPNWNYARRQIPDNVEYDLLKLLNTNSLKQGVNQIRPDLPFYNRLKKSFAHYDEVNKNGEQLPSIEYPGKALRKGDSLAAVGALKIRLSTYFTHLESNSNLFDEELEQVVKEFQSLNGLTADGIAGKATYRALNVSLGDKLDIIRANMERVRWLNNDFPDEFVLVNIASFNLYLIRDGQLDYECRVVVGKEHNQTPVFTSDIKYAVFNPTWTVPYSIASKEMLPRLKKDPNYLQNRNMTLLKGGKEVDPTTVDFSEFSTKYFPYTVRQEPGPKNALGQIKFIFPNKFSVYLHDTPSKSFFNRTERAFSHGCIRVQNPLNLAEELLGDKGYDQAKIREVLNTKKTKNVHLTSPMPVAIIYMTCDENTSTGKMHFYSDIYDRDKNVLRELKKSK